MVSRAVAISAIVHRFAGVKRSAPLRRQARRRGSVLFPRQSLPVETLANDVMAFLVSFPDAGKIHDAVRSAVSGLAAVSEDGLEDVTSISTNASSPRSGVCFNILCLDQTFIQTPTASGYLLQSPRLSPLHQDVRLATS